MLLSTHRLAALLPLTLLCNCGSDPSGELTAPDPVGGQTGAEVTETTLAPCRLVLQQDVSDTDESFGVSAEQLMGEIAKVHSGQWLWAGESDDVFISASLEVVRGLGSAQTFEFEPEPAASVQEGPLSPEQRCAAQSGLVVPIEVVLNTEDGMLQESWEFELRASAAGSATAVRPVPTTGFVGSFEPMSLLIDDETSLDIRAELQWLAPDLRLILEGSASRGAADPAGQLSTSVRRVPLGQFQSTPEE